MQYPVCWNHRKTGQEFVTFIEARSCFDALVEISKLYVNNTLTDRDYLRNIRECFRDDHGEDWLDEHVSFQRLANSLIDGE